MSWTSEDKVFDDVEQSDAENLSGLGRRAVLKKEKRGTRDIAWR